MIIIITGLSKANNFEYFSDDIKFKDLGLLIIGEEQRFG